jgi:hypothetical protein
MQYLYEALARERMRELHERGARARLVASLPEKLPRKQRSGKKRRESRVVVELARTP